MNDELLMQAWKKYSDNGWDFHSRPSMFDLFKAGWDSKTESEKEVKDFIEKKQEDLE